MSEYVYATDEHEGHWLTGEEIVRCRDCRHATITVNGKCKYCEMFWSPDTDGYGADSQLYLPGEFFCAFGERKVDA